MKFQNVFLAFLMLIIGLFVYISIAFGMIIASTRKSVKIADSKILDEKPDIILTHQNDVEAKSFNSLIDRRSDFLNSKKCTLDNEKFTPVLNI